jgi:hypothetical protein
LAGFVFDLCLFSWFAFMATPAACCVPGTVAAFFIDFWVSKVCSWCTDHMAAAEPPLDLLQFQMHTACYKYWTGVAV